ncbi:uncharacterized protein LOC131938587 [Physella acuta]|uniref:uncharacterized protein LOC131938587 n=1 Tax=Physella acuta TaxID=109671 RepID=UPI0027DC5186|nr:uncharacterized protein LOC131938587 [Physella acuta]
MLTLNSKRKLCNICFLLPSRVLAVILICLQGCVLDYFLVHYQNHNWYAWIAGDVAVILSFLVTFFISYRELKFVHDANSSIHKAMKSRVEPGSFPLSYFAWLVYSVILAARVGIIYKDLAFEIQPEMFLGRNILKFTVAMSGLVFLLLVAAHHDSDSGTYVRHQINVLTAIIPFDIIDAVDVLTIFFTLSQDVVEPAVVWAIVVIACANLVFPVVPLMILSGSHYGLQPVAPIKSILNNLFHIFIINAPLLAIRLLLWYKENMEVSPLIVKNIICILYGLKDVFETECVKKRDPNHEEAEETVSMRNESPDAMNDSFNNNNSIHD